MHHPLSIASLLKSTVFQTSPLGREFLEEALKQYEGMNITDIMPQQEQCDFQSGSLRNLVPVSSKLRHDSQWTVNTGSFVHVVVSPRMIVSYHWAPPR